MQRSDDAIKTADIPFYHTLSEDGVVMPAFLDQSKIKEIRGRKIDENDVFIASFPKSGSTWLKSMLMDLLSVDIPMYCTVPPHVTSHVYTPGIYKEHLPIHLLPPDISKCRVIYLIRNPKDVIVSFQHHMNLFTLDGYEGDINTMVNLFCSGKTQFGDWMGSVRGWCFEDRIKQLLIVSYEDLTSDCFYTMRKVLDFLDHRDVSDSTLRDVVNNSRFEQMRQRDLHYVPGCPSFFGRDAMRDGTKHFLREGKVGGWKKHLTVRNSEEIDRYVKKNGDFYELLQGLRIL